MQLVAYGAQDKDLTGNPQITFFKLVYRRYSNFAMESIEQTHTGSCDFGRRVSCAISRNGDLMSRVYVQATLPSVTQATAGKGSWIENVGMFLVKEAELEIGGQRIDRQYGQWMMIWNELAGSHTGEAGYNRMIGNEDIMTDPMPDRYSFTIKANGDFLGKSYSANDEVTFSYDDVAAEIMSKGTITFPKNTKNASAAPTDITSVENLRKELISTNGFTGATKTFPQRELLVPLNFWFCKNPGLALPLLALQYHEVKVNVTFESFDKLWNGVNADGTVDESVGTAGTPDNLDCKFWVDYLYLDNEERTRMASDQHEYLIEQVQYTGEESCMHSTNRFKLNFNHPCKELVWVVNPSNRRLGDFEYPNVEDSNPVKSAKITLNGHERFKERPGYYFDCVQPYQHHSRCPPERGINVYSFALNPEEHQPSGTCNFSRIDNSLLEIKTHNDSNNCQTSGYYCNAKAHIYAINYNSLRIMSGLGGIKFSN
jgi:hypothetical protein